MVIARTKDGKIAEVWNNFDFLSLYQQLGTAINLQRRGIGAQAFPLPQIAALTAQAKRSPRGHVGLNDTTQNNT